MDFQEKESWNLFGRTPTVILGFEEKVRVNLVPKWPSRFHFPRCLQRNSPFPFGNTSDLGYQLSSTKNIKFCVQFTALQMCWHKKMVKWHKITTSPLIWNFWCQYNFEACIQPYWRVFGLYKGFFGNWDDKFGIGLVNFLLECYIFQELVTFLWLNNAAPHCKPKGS